MAKPLKQSQLPAGWIVTPAGDMTEANPDLVVLCLELWHARANGSALDKLVENLKREILQGFDGLSPSCAILVEGVCRVSLKRPANRLKIENVAEVRALLGPRFDDLVEAKTTFAPREALVEMLMSADDALARALREHVKIVTGEPVVAIVAA